MTTARPSERAPEQLRAVTMETGVNRYAEGSCLIAFGHTRVLVTASVEENVPGWMRGKGQGWVTAEYGMLPRATHTRGRREAASGKQTGRTQEIQRLIGRSLRAVVDLKALGERQVVLDCDVVQADGGTRTAAITGAWVAMARAFDYLRAEGVLKADPILDQVAAISCGVCSDQPVLDLDYEEDSTAEADSNFVLTGSGTIVEIQATGEKRGFTRAEFDRLFQLAEAAAPSCSPCSGRRWGGRGDQAGNLSTRSICAGWQHVWPRGRPAARKTLTGGPAELSDQSCAAPHFNAAVHDVVGLSAGSPDRCFHPVTSNRQRAAAFGRELGRRDSGDLNSRWREGRHPDHDVTEGRAVARCRPCWLSQRSACPPGHMLNQRPAVRQTDFAVRNDKDFHRLPVGC